MKVQIIRSLLAIAIVLFAVMSYTVGVTGVDRGLIASCIGVVVLATLLWFVYQQNSRFKGHWTRPSNLLILGMLAVYYQNITDLMVGYKQVGDFVYPNVINKGIVISTLGFCCLIMGYTLRNKRLENKGSSFVITYHRAINKDVVAAVHMIAFLAFLYTIDVQSFITGTDYSGSAPVSISAYIELLFSALNILLLVSVINTAQNNTSFWGFLKQIPLVSLIVIAVYIVLRFFSGDRGPVIYTLLEFFYAYIFFSRKKIGLVLTIVVGVSAAFILTLIGMARGADLSLSFSDRMQDASVTLSESGRFGGKSIMPITEEMGFSYLSYQIICEELYEKGDNYKMGACQLVNVLSSVPFVSGFIHGTLGISKENTVSAYYATYRYVGYNPSWGTGTNIMGDFLLDFGPLGMAICMLLVGMFFKWTDNLLLFRDKRTINTFLLIVLIPVASKAIYMPRAEFFAFTKEVVFAWILLFILSTKKKAVLTM